MVVRYADDSSTGQGGSLPISRQGSHASLPPSSSWVEVYHSARRCPRPATWDVRFGSLADIRAAKSHVGFASESGHGQCTRPCLLWANSGHSNRSALAKRRTPGRGALIVKRLRGHSRSLPLPALAEQAGCGETANQPQKMYPYVMRLTLNHDGCD